MELVLLIIYYLIAVGLFMTAKNRDTKISNYLLIGIAVMWPIMLGSLLYLVWGEKFKE